MATKYDERSVSAADCRKNFRFPHQPAAVMPILEPAPPLKRVKLGHGWLPMNGERSKSGGQSSHLSSPATATA